jgi:NAD-dependent DNA ligase
MKTVATKILEIDWVLSFTTGYITPFAIVEPVQVHESIVHKLCLGNIKYVIENKISKGQVVYLDAESVIYKNKIVGFSPNYTFELNIPYIWKFDETQIEAVCAENFGDTFVQKIINFFDKLDIDIMRYVGKICNENFHGMEHIVQGIKCIFNLPKESLTRKAWDIIQEVKQKPAADLLFASGLFHKKITKEILSNILIGQPGIFLLEEHQVLSYLLGPKLTQIFFVSVPLAKIFIYELRSYCPALEALLCPINSDPRECIYISFNTKLYRNSDVISAVLKNPRYKIQKWPGHPVKYLIGEPYNNSQKSKKAEANNIEQITLNEFRVILGIPEVSGLENKKLIVLIGRHPYKNDILEYLKTSGEYEIKFRVSKLTSLVISDKRLTMNLQMAKKLHIPVMSFYEFGKKVGIKMNDILLPDNTRCEFEKLPQRVSFHKPIIRVFIMNGVYDKNDNYHTINNIIKLERSRYRIMLVSNMTKLTKFFISDGTVPQEFNWIISTYRIKILTVAQFVDFLLKN